MSSNHHSGSEFFSNFEGFLKKFKLTTENDKDQEIFTLANLDSGYIRKFIVKKVDERSLFRRSSQKSLRNDKSNKSSRNSSLKRKEKKKKKRERRTSNSSFKNAFGFRSTKAPTLSNGHMKRSRSEVALPRTVSNGSISSSKSEGGLSKEKKQKKKKESLSGVNFKIGWNSSSEESLSEEEETAEERMTASDREDQTQQSGYNNPAYVKEDYEDEGIGGLGKEEKERSEGDGTSETESISSLGSSSPSVTSRFNLKMSPRPKRKGKKKKNDGQQSPVSFRSGYQSNRSSISSARKGILKKSTSSTTINMEMASLSRPQTPTDIDDDAVSNGDAPRLVRTATLNRVKFILDSGKPDTITGDYEDIKMENKDRERAERSAKCLDDDLSSGLSKSGKKCLVFSAGVLIVTMAVILGSFFGSRKSAITNPDLRKLASSLDSAFIENALEGKFRITNEEFTNKLYNLESNQFKTITSKLEETMVKVIFLEESVNQPNSTTKLRIIKYEPGSVMATFRVKWEEKMTLSQPEIRKRVNAHLNQYGAFGEYKVDRASFFVGALKDQCLTKDCSKGCEFQSDTLIFSCTCPDLTILVNTTKCVIPAATTKKPSKPSKPSVHIPFFDDGSASLLKIDKETVSKNNSPKEGVKQQEIKGADKKANKTDQNFTTTAAVVPSTSSTAAVPSTSSTDAVPSTSSTAAAPSTTSTAAAPSTSSTAAAPSTSSTTAAPSTSSTAAAPSTSSTAAAPSTSLTPKKEETSSPTPPPSITFTTTITSSATTSTDNTTTITTPTTTTPPSNTSTTLPPNTTVNVTTTPPSNTITTLPSNTTVNVTTTPPSNTINTLLSNTTVNVTTAPPSPMNVTTITNTNTTFYNDTNIPSNNDTNLTFATTTTPPHLISSSSIDPLTTNSSVTEIQIETKNSATLQFLVTQLITENTSTGATKEVVNNKDINVETTTSSIVNITLETNISTPSIVKDNGTDVIGDEEKSFLPQSQVNETSLPTETPKQIITIQGVALGEVTTHKSTSTSTEHPEANIIEPTGQNQSEANIHIGLEDIADASHDLSIPVPITETAIETIIVEEPATNMTSNVSMESKPIMHKCKEDEFTCLENKYDNGYCIPLSSRCDSITDCSDGSDELHCIENKCHSNYQCRWSGNCLARKFVCDGVKHCTDGDDEDRCEIWKCNEREFTCGTRINSSSLCIESSLMCDSHSDCLDGSDEFNCSTECDSDEVLCREGKCIPKLWTCDGTRDCLAGEDEEKCGCDGLDQSPCVVGGCVPTFKLCDGLRHCPDGSDEWGCLKINNRTKQLQVRSSEGRWSSVCGNKWTSQWTDMVCEQLGLGLSLSTEVKRVTASVPIPRVKLSPDASEISRRGRAPLQYFFIHGQCHDDPLVHVSCKSPQCGNWTFTSPKVILGEKKESATWPSLGLLVQSYADRPMAHSSSCSASIITSTWVMSSYSCLASKSSGFHAEKWALLVGEKSPKVGNEGTQLRHTKQMVVYPGAKRIDGMWVGDAVLLRLQTPLSFSSLVQPICLTEQPIASHDQCLIATWKPAEGDEDRKIQTIQSLPIPNLTKNTCNTSYYNGNLKSSHVCASFQGKNAPCTGNEGSPLMCRRKDNDTWYLQGLMSHVGNCASFNLPSIFTDVTSIDEWILRTIGRHPTEAEEGSVAAPFPRDSNNNTTTMSTPGAEETQSVVSSSNSNIVTPSTGKTVLKVSINETET